MKLEDLVGKHYLTGVDMNTVPVEYDDAQVMNFVLDGVTYIAKEDPADGYRSCMEDIMISSYEVSNQFPPQEVLCRMAEDSSWERNDILEVIDVVTGKKVLEVGTSNWDDYYPTFVGAFYPENMAINMDV